MSVTSEIMLPSSFQCSAPFFSGRTPVPSGVNHQYQIITLPNGRHRLADSKEYTQYKEDAANALTEAYLDREVIKAIASSREHVPLYVLVRFFYRTLWKQDLDGGIKAVVDAAFKCMGLNDNLNIRLLATKEIDRADPHVEIDICCVLSPVSQK